MDPIERYLKRILRDDAWRNQAPAELQKEYDAFSQVAQKVVECRANLPSDDNAPVTAGMLRNALDAVAGFALQGLVFVNEDQKHDKALIMDQMRESFNGLSACFQDVVAKTSKVTDGLAGLFGNQQSPAPPADQQPTDT